LGVSIDTTDRGDNSGSCLSCFCEGAGRRKKKPSGSLRISKFSVSIIFRVTYHNAHITEDVVASGLMNVGG
jgi:hypothetical protein